MRTTAVALLVATTQAARINLIGGLATEDYDSGYLMYMNQWREDSLGGGTVHIEPTLEKARGTFFEVGDEDAPNYDPNVIQTLLFTTDEIPEEELATLNIETDDDKFTWFERVQFTYMTELGIWMVLASCKNDDFEEGEVFIGADCGWNYFGDFERWQTTAYDFRGSAKRPLSGNEVINVFGDQTTVYKVYASYALKDKETDAVVVSGGPSVTEFIFALQYGLASSGLAVASATLLAALTF